MLSADTTVAIHGSSAKSARPSPRTTHVCGNRAPRAPTMFSEEIIVTHLQGAAGGQGEAARPNR